MTNREKYLDLRRQVLDQRRACTDENMKVKLETLGLALKHLANHPDNRRELAALKDAMTDIEAEPSIDPPPLWQSDLMKLMETM